MKEVKYESVHKSKNCDDVINRISHNRLTKRAKYEINNGSLIGLYLTKTGNIRGFNVWNETFKAAK